MPKTTPEQNKALVLEGFDTLFNKRDYTEAERRDAADSIRFQHAGRRGHTERKSRACR